ncbi:ATP-binding protein [Streptomyces griseus]|uniref:NACHT domain-containing protein n=1 Tax=Streptomyces griseus TaxID=1911 RepID=UPI00056753EE|nr:ATP-binding protein [Streptomyces griseus]
MTSVVRRPPGKERPRNAPMATLDLRRACSRVRSALVGRWHTLTMRLEARRGATRPKKWRRWFSYANATRFVWALAVLALLAWCGEGLYIWITGESTRFEELRKHGALDAVFQFVGPVLTASIAAALFLFCWYGWTKRRYLGKASRSPGRLVLPVGQDTGDIVGRDDVAEVIAERLRDRDTRRPYLLVGGVGVGKTAVLVRLTELLARQHAVPVPVRLRDAAGEADLNFERMAKQRFADETPQGTLARTKNDRVWQQLLADDKPVVIADGLEEALLDDSLQQNRDNIIRRAIERAHREKLPLVIASRPHSPLESTAAAIVELEPLSEEEALHFVEARASGRDEQYLDAVVETAEVTESPVYLQIVRELHRDGLLRHDDSEPLDTSGRDRSTLRLQLLEKWERALCEGRLRQDVALSRQERGDTVEVVSALACIGLLNDTLEVGFAELLGDDAHPGPLRRARTRAEHLWTSSRGFDQYGKRDTVFSEWHRERIWNTLCARLSAEEGRRLREGSRDQCQAILARFAANANKLRLLEGLERKVRFPHSIIQAYLGFRALDKLGERVAGELVEEALQPPGPGRELLVALVFLSRRSASRRAIRSGGVRAEAKREIQELVRQAPVHGRTLTQLLRTAASRRTDDPKVLDLYAAALEVESVEEAPERLKDIVRAVHDCWPGIKGDRRTLDDAKLTLIKQLGAVLRRVSDRIDTGGLYWRLFVLGVEEPSYGISLAAAQECGSGGSAAFAVIREHFGLHNDPVREYNDAVADLKARKSARYAAWAKEMAAAQETNAGVRSGTPSPDRTQRQQDELRALNAEYGGERVRLLRNFVMRAWILPMLLGSVDEAHRDEAQDRLARWLSHLDPVHAGGTADLPLALEAALAKGFKYAANRRRSHPHTDQGSRADLIRQAETFLQRSRCWYAQLSLLHALCLWELPDAVGPPGQVDGDLSGRPPRRIGGTTAVDTVKRWLSTAGTVNRAPGSLGGNGGNGGNAGNDWTGLPRRCLHPFVSEAGDLVALALETGQPERFLWIDEKGVADNIGSRVGHVDGSRRHNLWVPPSVGWSTLDGRAQRLVADVLVLLNLVERDGNPDEVEERMARAEQPGMSLPPCIRTRREPLEPGMPAGTAVPPAPGSNCLPDCKFKLCPYPPRGSVPRDEIREPFCRQQQALLPGRVRRCFPRGLRRKTPPWVSMRVRELDGFWDAMARRTRS